MEGNGVRVADRSIDQSSVETAERLWAARLELVERWMKGFWKDAGAASVQFKKRGKVIN